MKTHISKIFLRVLIEAKAGANRRVGAMIGVLESWPLSSNSDLFPPFPIPLTVASAQHVQIGVRPCQTDACYSINFFKAGIDDLGNIFGEVQQVTHLPDKDFKFHGTVLCFDPVNENTAVFVGVIDSSSDPPSRTNFFVVEVVDDTPDQYGFDITTREPDCTRVNVREQDLIRGSIHVH